LTVRGVFAMKRFAFALESVLRFKRRREWLAELGQKQAAAALQQARAEVVVLRDRLDGVCTRLHDKLGKTLDTAAWMAAYHQSALLAQALETATQAVDRATRTWERAAAVHKQAAMEVEVLLTLRREKEQEHRRDALQAGQEEVNEATLRRWHAGGPAGEAEEGAGT
jgi:flagellar export protein FliJ